MKRLDLKSEVNLNKKFILILVLVCVLTIGLYTSYAYFQITVIQNNVVVLQTASIDIITNIEGYDNPTFTLNSGESKTITVNLSSTADGDIAYKMYYIMTSGEATFEVTSTTSFLKSLNTPLCFNVLTLRTTAPLPNSSLAFNIASVSVSA